MIQFDFLRLKSAEKIIEQIKAYPIVSFDIFDTLLKRDVLNPTDVFKIVGNMHDDKDFFEKRIKAESLARQNIASEEISLDDIYEILGDKYSTYKFNELTVEQSILKINPLIYKVYKWCRQQGKIILVTSDMYLPASFLKAILRFNNIEYDFCYISSEYGYQKVSGNLFKKELTDLGISSKEIVHIGDSLKGDYLGAYKAGIKGILIPKKINFTKLVDITKKQQQLQFNTFINNNLKNEDNIYYELGYAYFGPVLFGFSKWLHNMAKGRKVFFFARDGYLVQILYKNLYPNDENEYIYLSRRSLSVPLLWKHSEWGEFNKCITLTRYFTVQTFIERLGLPAENYLDQIKECGLTLDTQLKEKKFLYNSKLKRLYDSIKQDIIKNSKEEFNALAVYFHEKEFYGDLVIMDIGWNGSMQKYLIEIMEILNRNVKITGCYFGMRKKILNNEAYGYFYDSRNMKLEPKISFMQGLFESFFLSQEGSTKRYFLREGRAFVECYSPEYKREDKEYQAFKDIQKGAHDFCINYSKSYVSKNIDFSALKYSGNLIQFGTDPSLSETFLFGDFRFYDTNVVYLAKPEKVSYYLTHPKNFLRDFSYSVWKAAFFKRLLKLNFPYFKIYLLTKLFLK